MCTSCTAYTHTHTKQNLKISLSLLPLFLEYASYTCKQHKSFLF